MRGEYIFKKRKECGYSEGRVEQDKTKTQQGKQLTDPVALSHTGGGLHSPYITPPLEISMSPVCYFHCLYAALHDRRLIAW